MDVNKLLEIKEGSNMELKNDLEIQTKISSFLLCSDSHYNKC